MNKRIGVFGGSFDPVHFGHLLLAEQCLDAANLDLIKFIPAAVPPHKQDVCLTDSQSRIEMLQLATASHSKFEIDRCEIERGEVSYTVDTLMHLKKTNPDTSLFLMIGADSLLEFHTWKDPQNICELAIPLIVRRPPVEQIDFKLLEPYVDSERLKEIQSLSFKSLQIELCSSQIRERVAAQKSIRFQTPRGVEELINNKKLYLTGS